MPAPAMGHVTEQWSRFPLRAGYASDGLASRSRGPLAVDRLSALWQITIPVWQATAKLPAPIWWSHFERAMLAFEDLGCAELLD
jgi:hypothetical protein